MLEVTLQYNKLHINNLFLVILKYNKIYMHSIKFLNMQEDNPPIAIT